MILRWFIESIYYFYQDYRASFCISSLLATIVLWFIIVDFHLLGVHTTKNNRNKRSSTIPTITTLRHIYFSIHLLHRFSLNCLCFLSPSNQTCKSQFMLVFVVWLNKLGIDLHYNASIHWMMNRFEILIHLKWIILYELINSMLSIELFPLDIQSFKQFDSVFRAYNTCNHRLKLCESADAACGNSWFICWHE